MSPAAQLKPFGIPVGQALVKIRSDPNLMQALGTPSYTLKPPAEQYGVSGLSHYNMFANGAVPAYAHQLKARLSSTPVPAEFGVPAGTTYSDWMGRKLEDFVAARTGQRINPFEVNLNFMPHDQQVGLMEQFHQSLSPEEQAFRLKAEDPGRRELFQLVISSVKGKQARNSAYSRQEKWFLFTAIRQVGQSTADPR